MYQNRTAKVVTAATLPVDAVGFKGVKTLSQLIHDKMEAHKPTYSYMVANVGWNPHWSGFRYRKNIYGEVIGSGFVTNTYASTSMEFQVFKTGFRPALEFTFIVPYYTMGGNSSGHSAAICKTNGNIQILDSGLVGIQRIFDLSQIPAFSI